MGIELRRRQQLERRQSLAQLVELSVVRRIVGHAHIDICYALTEAIDGLCRMRDRHARAALAEGETKAEVGRAVGMSGQGVGKRYGHLEVVS